MEDEEAEKASSGEDEFYDRTMETKKKRSKAAAQVEDAASLYGRKAGALLCIHLISLAPTRHLLELNPMVEWQPLVWRMPPRLWQKGRNSCATHN